MALGLGKEAELTMSKPYAEIGRTEKPIKGAVRFVFDTDILVDHLRGFPPAKNLLVGKREAQNQLIISAITEAELFAGRTMRDAESVERTELLLSVFEIVSVNSGVAREAGRLKREYDCSLPDALIAATAILLGAELITRNERHFKMIPVPFKFTVPY